MYIGTAAILRFLAVEHIISISKYGFHLKKWLPLKRMTSIKKNGVI